MQHFGDFRKVDKGGFFGSDFDHLRRPHHKLLLFAHDGIRIFVLDDVIDSLQELIVGVIPIMVGPSRSIFLFFCNVNKMATF